MCGVINALIKPQVRVSLVWRGIKSGLTLYCSLKCDEVVSLVRKIHIELSMNVKVLVEI